RVFGTFERFHEGHYEAQGTGLGLALTKQLVELHGGTIDFVTAEGRGTRFTIHLPQVVVPLTDDRVLIVEDEPRDAQLIAALARHHGLATEVTATAASAIASIRRRVPIGIVLDLRLPDARDGSQALDRALAQKFDLILLDIQMPGLDGYDVCRALRAKGLKTPILALSASAMPTDVHKGHAAGFDAYLTKPISPHDLLRAVRSHTRTAA